MIVINEIESFSGEMAEWTKAADSKSAMGVTSSKVRILVSPNFYK